MKKVILFVVLFAVTLTTFSMGPNTTYNDYQEMKNSQYDILGGSSGQSGTLEYLRKRNSSIDTIDMNQLGSMVVQEEYVRTLELLAREKPVTGQAGLEEYLYFARTPYRMIEDKNEENLKYAEK